jgi:peptide/nickel transport system substrate-binding protein
MSATWLRCGLAGALLFSGACRGDGPPVVPIGDRPERGGTVVIAGSSDLDVMNALVSGERWTQEIIRHVMFLPLLAYDAGLELEPRLARSFEQHGDTVVVFQLRDDVRWHDGVPTTAYDVAFSFERAKDPETAFPNAAYFARWQDVEVLDSLTVRFRMQPHLDPLAALPFFPIMPRHWLDTIPPARLRQAAFNRQPVGNGPFRFVEYRANERWVFEANPDFSEGLGGRPHIDRLVWRVVPETSARVTELRVGTVDVMLNPLAGQIPDLPNLRTIVRPSRMYTFIGWNGRRPPLDDARVRRALAMALNRRQIVDALRDGHGEPAVGPIGPHHWSYDSSMAALPYDVEAARALLRQAGIEDRSGDGMLQLPDGRPFAIELKMPAGDAFNRDLAELIRRDLTALGVRLTTRPTEFGTMVADISPPGRNFDAVILAWESDFRVDLRDLFHSAAADGLFGMAGYRNAEVDSIIDRLQLVTDRTAAKPLLLRLQQVLRDEQPWGFLYYYPELLVARERVRGLDMDVRGVFINVQNWWVPRAAQGRTRGEAEADDSAGHDPLPEPAPGT